MCVVMSIIRVFECLRMKKTKDDGRYTAERKSPRRKEKQKTQRDTRNKPNK